MEVRIMSPVVLLSCLTDWPTAADTVGVDGDANVGGAHRKYGLEDGGIVVCRPDGYGKATHPSASV
jgi:hypothetical protein